MTTGVIKNISLRGQNLPVLFTKLENRFLQTNDITIIFCHAWNICPITEKVICQQIIVQKTDLMREKACHVFICFFLPDGYILQEESV